MFTAITARYDTLKLHPDIPGVDWVAFTDNPEDRDRTDWRVIGIHPSAEHSRMVAKAYKLLPHLYLPEYEYNIWLDGSFEVTSPTFVDEALACVKDTGIAMWRHSHRDDVFAEAAASVEAKYDGVPLAEQARYYASVGLPAMFGVWCTGVMARRTHDRNVVRLMDAWMDENRRWTYQDQVSFSFALWRLGLPEPGPLPPHWSATRCPWFTMHEHNAQREVP